MARESSPVALLVGDARGRLLDEVIRSDRPRSIRDWARRADVNHAHARHLLDEFAELGLVRSTHVGSSIVFQGVPQSALRKRLQGLLRVHEDIIDAARVAARTAPPGVQVTLFGSVAHGSQGPGSDLDVCIVAPESPDVEEWVNSYTETLHAVASLPVSLLRFTPSGWEAAVAGSEPIVDEILNRGISLSPVSV